MIAINEYAAHDLAHPAAGDQCVDFAPGDARGDEIANKYRPVHAWSMPGLDSHWPGHPQASTAVQLR
jgi:hypothetical protein